MTRLRCADHPAHLLTSDGHCMATSPPHKPRETLTAYPGYRLTGPDGMLAALTDEQMKEVLADKGLDLSPRPPRKETKEAPVKDANIATLSTIIDGERIEGELGTAAGVAVAEAFVRKSMGLPPNPADYPGLRFEEATGEVLPYQPTLDDKVFAKYTPQHQVGLKLTKGSAKLPLASFGKLLSGEKLERGREVIVTARYFAKDVHVPAVQDAESSMIIEGDGLVELELLNVRSLEVGAQILHKLSPWKSCDCLAPYDVEIDGEYPPNRNVLGYPLDGWSALQGCATCSGSGYFRLTEKPGEWEKGDE